MATTTVHLEDPSHMQPTINELARRERIKQCTPINATALKVEYDDSEFDDGHGGKVSYDDLTIDSIYLNVVHELRPRNRNHPLEIAARATIRAAVEGLTPDSM